MALCFALLSVRAGCLPFKSYHTLVGDFAETRPLRSERIRSVVLELGRMASPSSKSEVELRGCKDQLSKQMVPFLRLACCKMILGSMLDPVSNCLQMKRKLWRPIKASEERTRAVAYSPERALDILPPSNQNLFICGAIVPSCCFLLVGLSNPSC